MWGDPAVGHVTVDQINAAFNDPSNGLRKLIEEVTTEKCECANTMCSGHGRCYGIGTAAVQGGYSACQCFDGYTGANCTVKLDEGKVNAHLVDLDDVDTTKPLESGVMCPDAISMCAEGQTCGQFIGGRWGCCPLEHAVLCGDSRHCCPNGYSCDAAAGVCYK